MKYLAAQLLPGGTIIYPYLASLASHLLVITA